MTAFLLQSEQPIRMLRYFSTLTEGISLELITSELYWEALTWRTKTLIRHNSGPREPEIQCLQILQLEFTNVPIIKQHEG